MKLCQSLKKLFCLKIVQKFNNICEQVKTRENQIWTVAFLKK